MGFALLRQEATTQVVATQLLCLSKNQANRGSANLLSVQLLRSLNLRYDFPFPKNPLGVMNR
jgi:hypothetical protein